MLFSMMQSGTELVIVVVDVVVVVIVVVVVEVVVAVPANQSTSYRHSFCHLYLPHVSFCLFNSILLSPGHVI